MKLLAFSLVASVLVVSAQGQTATYLFGGNLDAAESGVGALSATNPINQNAYSTASLYGATRSVYDEFGASGAGMNSGLTFDDSSGLINANHYTLELVVAFNDTGSGWKKIADTSGGLNDAGFYVDPYRKLSYYPGGPGYSYYSGPDDVTLGFHAFHYIALSFDGNATKTYLDGRLEASFSSPAASIDNSPSKLVNLFLDDAGTSYREYSDNSVALVRFTDGVLSDGDIASRNQDPFSPTPEPASIAFLGFGFAGLVGRMRKRVH